MKADTFRLLEAPYTLWLIAEIFQNPNKHRDHYGTDTIRTDELRNRISGLRDAGIVKELIGSRGGCFETLTTPGWDIGGLAWEMVKKAAPWPEDVQAERYPPRLYIERPGALALLCEIAKNPGGDADTYAPRLGMYPSEVLNGLKELTAAGLIIGPKDARRRGAVPLDEGAEMAFLAESLLKIAQDNDIDLSQEP